MTETVAEQATCGRPTRLGRSCLNGLARGEVACSVHATEEDKALQAAWLAGNHKGWSDGYAAGHAAGRRQVELEQAAGERERRERERLRLRDSRGQLVVVDGRYTYRWTGLGDLEVGDRVIAPGSWLDANPRTVTVTALGSSYDGEIVDLRGRAV